MRLKSDSKHKISPERTALRRAMTGNLDYATGLKLATELKGVPMGEILKNTLRQAKQ